MHPNTPLEHAVAENDALPHKKRRTNDEIAQEYDTSEASVRRARKRLKNGKSEKTALKVEGTTEELEFDNLVLSEPAHEGAFKAIFDLAGLSQSDYALKDGSLRFSTWQQSAMNTDTGERDTIQLYSYKGTFERITDNSIDTAELLEYIHTTPPQPTKADTKANHQLTAFLCISDLQLGKAMERGGGTKETITAVKTAAQAFIDKYLVAAPEVVLVDGGDIIENMFNAPSQPYTNDLDLAGQLKAARHLVLEIIQELAPYTSKITYVTVPSNHGAVRASRSDKGNAGTVDADYGLDIHDQVMTAIGMAPDDLRSKVHSVTPDSLEETAVLTTADGTKVAFNHGHRAPHGKAAEWWARQDHGRMPGWDADILVTAHYHSLSVQQSGDSRWIIQTSSPEPGSGWFQLQTGKHSQRGLTAFTVSHGMWYNLTVLPS